MGCNHNNITQIASRIVYKQSAVAVHWLCIHSVSLCPSLYLSVPVSISISFATCVPILTWLARQTEPQSQLWVTRATEMNAGHEVQQELQRELANSGDTTRDNSGNTSGNTFRACCELGHNLWTVPRWFFISMRSAAQTYFRCIVPIVLSHPFSPITSLCLQYLLICLALAAFIFPSIYLSARVPWAHRVCVFTLSLTLAAYKSSCVLVCHGIHLQSHSQSYSNC